MKPQAAQAKPVTAKQAHRMLAAFILVFLLVHFATHFTALGGAQLHGQAQSVGRLFYQFPLIEIALVLALATQVVLGIKLLTMIRKRVRKGFWHKVQFFSATYLAYFIIMHTSAAVVTRLGIGLDTNFYWVAGTLVLDPLRYYFAPYYTLAVTAIFAHLIAALHFRGKRRWHGPALVVGPLIGITFVLGYASAFDPFELPPTYQDYFADFPGVDGPE